MSRETSLRLPIGVLLAAGVLLADGCLLPSVTHVEGERDSGSAEPRGDAGPSGGNASEAGRVAEDKRSDGTSASAGGSESRAAPGNVGDGGGTTGGQPSASTRGAAGQAGVAGSAPASAGSRAAPAPGLASLGVSCSWPDARACVSRGDLDLLRCDGSHWVSAGRCEPDGSSCYVWPGPIAGTCKFESDACDDAHHGKLICSGQSVHQCDEQVSGASTRKETCAGDTPDCEAAQCVCKSHCDGKCVSLQWDDKHCGACGQDCGGNHCSEGKCQPLVLAKGRIDTQVQIVVDDSYLYWAEANTRSLMRTPLQGGDSVALVTLGSTQSVSFISDGKDFYWANWTAGTISKQARMGGPIMMLASGQSWAVSLIADATNLYWVAGEMPQSVQKLPKSGGQISSLFQDTRPDELVLDGTNLYYTNSFAEIVQQSTDGMQRKSLASGSELLPIGLQNGNLYYQVNRQSVARVPVPSGTGSTQVASDARILEARIDATYVYWINATGAMRQSLAGGEAAVQLTTGNFARLTLDERWVYLADLETIVRVAKQ